MKKIISSIFFIMFIGTCFAQDAIKQLKLEKLFQEAEAAFTSEDYKTAITKLNEFEKQFGGATDKSLYLRALSYTNKFLKAHESGYREFTLGGKVSPQFYFDDLMYEDYFQAVKHTKKYMELMQNGNIDDKFKEIFDASEKINAQISTLFSNRDEYLKFRDDLKKKWTLQIHNLAEKFAVSVIEPAKVVNVTKGVLTISVLNVEPKKNSTYKGLGKKHIVDLNIVIDFNYLDYYNRFSGDNCKFKQCKVVNSSNSNSIFKDNCSFEINIKDNIWMRKAGTIYLDAPNYSDNAHIEVQIFDKEIISKFEEDVERAALKNSFFEYLKSEKINY